MEASEDSETGLGGSGTGDCVIGFGVCETGDDCVTGLTGTATAGAVRDGGTAAGITGIDFGAADTADSIGAFDATGTLGTIGAGLGDSDAAETGAAGAEADFGVVFAAFGATTGLWNLTISASTSARGLENCSREASMISFIYEISGCGIGGSVVAENGADDSPSIINLR